VRKPIDGILYPVMHFMPITGLDDGYRWDTGQDVTTRIVIPQNWIAPFLTQRSFVERVCLGPRLAQEFQFPSQKRGYGMT